MDGTSSVAPGRSDRRAAAHLVLHALLALLLVAASYAAPVWSQAFAGERFRVREHLLAWATAIPAGIWNLAIPAIMLLMLHHQAMAARSIARSRLGGSPAFLAGGAILMAALSVAAFPCASHDLELYHAHARMVATFHANPYTATPAQVFDGNLPETVPWTNQRAPYGPLAILLDAALVGRIVRPWTAALVLKILYALPTLLFVAVSLAAGAASPARRVAAVVAVAWQPLLLLELGANGHCDGLMAALAALAIVFLVRGRRWLGWSLLGLASLVKIEAMVFLPLLIAFDLARKPRRAQGAWMAAIPILILAAGYLPWGGPQNALPGLKDEAGKVLRSVPETAALLTGASPLAMASWLRVGFLLILAWMTWRVARGGSVLSAAALVWGAAMVLGKSFLQPWHGAMLVYLLGAWWLLGEPDRRLARVTGAWSFFAWLGGYSYLLAVGTLAPLPRAVSTIVMAAPPLMVLAAGSLPRPQRSARR